MKINCLHFNTVGGLENQGFCISCFKLNAYVPKTPLAAAANELLSR